MSQSPRRRDDATAPKSPFGFEFWCELDELKPADYDPACDCCDIVATMSDGRHYRFRVWTYSFLEELVSRDRESGERLGGKYMLPPDLFVERLDRDLLQRAVADMLERDDIEFEKLESSGHEEVEASDEEDGEAFDDDENGQR